MIKKQKQTKYGNIPDKEKYCIGDYIEITLSPCRLSLCLPRETDIK